MAKKSTIAAMIEAAYECEECRKYVLQSANENATVRRIEKGELVLPSPVDAHRTHIRESERKAQEAQQQPRAEE